MPDEFGIYFLFFVAVEEIPASGFLCNIQREVYPEHAQRELVLMVERLPYRVVACPDFLFIVLIESNIVECQVQVIFAV